MPRTSPTKQPEQPNIYAMVQQVMERDKCRTDPVYFISTYLKVLEPRGEYEIGWKKFELWAKQVEFIRALQSAYASSQYLVVKKPRDVGATQTVLAYAFWCWLFIPEFIILVGSRKEDEVDRGKEKKKGTLFAKLDGFMDSLPAWLVPNGYNRKDHRAHMLMYNPENKASFVGEAMNEGFGKSNRASMVIPDEYAEWEYDVFGSILHVCKFVVPISTIMNENDHFDKLCQRAKSQGRLFEFEWQDNPGHTQQWFDDMLNSSDPVEFARNVTMSYEAARGDLVYPQIRKVVIGTYEYHPDWPLIPFWDFGLRDETYLGFLQRDPETLALYLIDEVVAAEKDILWFVPFCPGLAKPLIPNPYIYTEEQDARIEEHLSWKRPVLHIGDPSGKQRNQITKTSIFDELAPFGIRPKCDPKFYLDMSERTRAARRALGRLHIDERCRWFLKSFRGYHYPEIKPNSQRTTASNNPVHDENSHACTAFEFFAISERFIRDEDTTAKQKLQTFNPWKYKRTA